jgi:hypothetical protein
MTDEERQEPIVSSEASANALPGIFSALPARSWQKEGCIQALRGVGAICGLL